MATSSQREFEYVVAARVPTYATTCGPFQPDPLALAAMGPPGDPMKTAPKIDRCRKAQPSVAARRTVVRPNPRREAPIR